MYQYMWQRFIMNRAVRVPLRMHLHHPRLGESEVPSTVFNGSMVEVHEKETLTVSFLDVLDCKAKGVAVQP